MAQPSITLKRETHHNSDVLSIYMKKDDELNSIAKQLNARYSASRRMWHIPFDSKAVNRVFEAYKGRAFVDYSSITDTGRTPKASNIKKTEWTKAQKDAMWAYADKLKVRRYSKSAFTTYGYFFKQYLAAHPSKDPRDITEKEIIAHVVKTVEARNYSTKTQNQIINSIKFYYEKVLELDKKTYWIPRPRKETKLPTVASEEEVVRLLVAAANTKHQCIIGMLYSTGIRRGELINLRLADIDIDRRQVFVRGGKGKKDRVTVLSDRMINALNKYSSEWHPQYWLFEGPGGKRYSGTSIGMVVKNAVQKAGIKKNITPHVLRHSFATHMMERGTDTRYIQELLGHASIETTAIYAHVSRKNLAKIKSPLDRIFEDNELNNNNFNQQLPQ